MRLSTSTSLSFLLLAVSLAAPLPRAAAQAAPAAAGSEFPRDWFWHDSEDKFQKHQKLVGKPMPELNLSDWTNKKVDLKSDLKGKVVVLDFWATWCGPCIASIPHNNEMAEKFEKDGLVFLAVCCANGQEKMADIVKEKGIKYSVAKDSKLKSGKAWDVMFYPTYAVVDRAGKLRAIGLKPDHVEEVVKKLLEEKAPEPPAK